MVTPTGVLPRYVWTAVVLAHSRLTCHADDAVFLVFLYQRWIYRIDPSRANEYGQILVQDEEDEKGETKKTR